MKLWTMQDLGAYEELKLTGLLRASEKYVWKDFIFQYDWMAEQMKERIGEPPSKDIKYPIWAWYQWNGINKKKPDLRCSGFSKRGTKLVFLELEVKPNKVLLSDFDGFNGVLNHSYIADSEEEYDRFYNELESYGFKHIDLYSNNNKSNVLEEFKSNVFKSWEKIFDLQRVVDERWSGSKEEQSIQATLWEIRLEQVISAKEFIAK